MWTRRFHYDNHLWVLLALWDGEPVGFVCLLPDGESERGLLLDNLRSARSARPWRRPHPAAGRRRRGDRLQAGTPMHLWVYEANSDARRFYNRMGGEMVDRENVLAPDGSKAIALCYRWKQPALLASGTPPDPAPHRQGFATLAACLPSNTCCTTRPALLAQVQARLDDGSLGDWLASRYPDSIRCKAIMRCTSMSARSSSAI
jgi:hypothetical protein